MRRKNGPYKLHGLRHVGNYGNELADNLAKEATKNKETIYKKNTEKSNSATGDTTKYRKVANQMGTNNKRINNKTIPTKH